MKKLIFGSFFLVLASTFPVMTTSAEDQIGFPLPPPLVLVSPPEMIVIPDTYVYVDPDIDYDLFFYGGWWWRPWEGRWYRSDYYDGKWGYYDGVPSFYFDVDPDWRIYYRDHNWYGHRWNYKRIPGKRLQQNWKSWQNDRTWEGRRNWGVESYQPLTEQRRHELRKQRQWQYEQRRREERRHHRVEEPEEHEQRPRAREPEYKRNPEQREDEHRGEDEHRR